MVLSYGTYASLGMDISLISLVFTFTLTTIIVSTSDAASSAPRIKTFNVPSSTTGTSTGSSLGPGVVPGSGVELSGLLVGLCKSKDTIGSISLFDMSSNSASTIKFQNGIKKLK